MAEASRAPLRALRVAVVVAVCTAMVAIAALATQVPPLLPSRAVLDRRRWPSLRGERRERWGGKEKGGDSASQRQLSQSVCCGRGGARRGSRCLGWDRRLRTHRPTPAGLGAGL